MTNVTTIRPQPQPARDTFEAYWRTCPAIMRERSSKAITERLWTEITTTGRTCTVPLKDSGEVVEKFRIPTKATPEEILTGLERYIASHYDPQTFKYDRYLCGAAVFLNQGKFFQ